MKKVSCFLIVILIISFLAGCGGGDTAEPAQVESADVVVEEEQNVPEATAVPELTAEQQTDENENLITSAEEIAGTWEGTIAGERGYFMYTPDGRFLVALAQENLTTTPRVSGEYWFEDGQIHLKDLENAGHWVVCDAETIGVYEAVILENGKVKFQTISDDCDEGGFTRNYLFATMTQERIADSQ